MNEMYAADISRKVRSTKKLMAEQGKFSNSRAPYGYKKSKENKHVLVVDENVSQNIVRIFELYLSGMPARAIADMLNRDGIVTPNEYFYSALGKPNPFRNNKKAWGSASIMNILKNPAYFGAISNGKRTVTSFKNKHIVCKPASEWIVVEGTHEALITKEQWEEAQRIGSKNKKDTVRRSADGEVSIFAGIIKCADCGGNMIFNRKVHKSSTDEFYRCSTYQQKGKNVCSMHRTDYNVLYQAVLSDIQQYAVLAVEDEQQLIKCILKENNAFKEKNVSRYKKHIRETNNRIREIDRLLQNLYEDKVIGEVTPDLFKRMTLKYEDERTNCITDLQEMETELDECQRIQQDLKGWVARIRECLTIKTLTRAIVVELIDRVEVGETDDSAGKKSMNLETFYKFGLKSAEQSKTKENRAS
jgi:site-specific DNA recombinase